MRVPRMQGTPPTILGSAEIRSNFTRPSVTIRPGTPAHHSPADSRVLLLGHYQLQGAGPGVQDHAPASRTSRRAHGAERGTPTFEQFLPRGRRSFWHADRD